MHPFAWLHHKSNQSKVLYYPRILSKGPGHWQELGKYNTWKLPEHEKRFQRQLACSPH